MDGKGSWKDNVFVERLWKSVADEGVYLKSYETIPESRRSVVEYLEFHNSRWPQSSLDRMTSNQFYLAALPR